MASTNEESIYVHNHDELQRTVQNLVMRGGVVQNQTDTEVTVFIKKKLNIAVLVVGLLLCLVPGLAYLIWYLSADQNQVVHVTIGKAPNIGGYHPVDETGDAAGGAGATATSGAPTPPAPAGLPPQDPASQIPTMPTPTAEPVPQPPPPPPTAPGSPGAPGSPEAF